MRVWASARADYAVRAAVELAKEPRRGGLVKARAIADAQGIPIRFLLSILRALTVAGIATSHRGIDGGFALARSPNEVSVAEVVRAVEPETGSEGHRHRHPKDPRPGGLDLVVERLAAEAWATLETLTLAQLAAGGARSPRENREHLARGASAGRPPEPLRRVGALVSGGARPRRR